jgi:hypothetical protein
VAQGGGFFALHTLNAADGACDWEPPGFVEEGVFSWARTLVRISTKPSNIAMAKRFIRVRHKLSDFA